jgi:hypothetical protein
VRSNVVLGGTTLEGGKIHRVNSGDRGGYAVYPRHPIHLPGYVSSATAGHLHPSALQPLRAETTTSASQLVTHLQVAPAEQFPENRCIVDQPSCRVEDRGPRQCVQPFEPRR